MQEISQNIPTTKDKDTWVWKGDKTKDFTIKYLDSTLQNNSDGDWKGFSYN